MKLKTEGAMHGTGMAIAMVLLALASGGGDSAEPLRTLIPGTLRIGTYFVNPPLVRLRLSVERPIRLYTESD